MVGMNSKQISGHARYVLGWSAIDPGWSSRIRDYSSWSLGSNPILCTLACSWTWFSAECVCWADNVRNCWSHLHSTAEAKIDYDENNLKRRYTCVLKSYAPGFIFTFCFHRGFCRSPWYSSWEWRRCLTDYLLVSLNSVIISHQFELIDHCSSVNHCIWYRFRVLKNF